MKSAWPWLALLAMLGGMAPARANPVTYGQQKAWDYIVREHTRAAMANAQAVIPWYSAASDGWAVGTALGNGERAPRNWPP